MCERTDGRLVFRAMCPEHRTVCEDADNVLSGPSDSRTPCAISPSQLASSLQHNQNYRHRQLIFLTRVLALDTWQAP